MQRFKLGFVCFSAGNLGERAGVAAGCHPGVFRPRTRLRIRHRVLLVQPGPQQLPQGRADGLGHQLHDVCARHAGRVRRAGFPGQEHRDGLCGRVRVSRSQFRHICSSLSCLNYFILIPFRNIGLLNILVSSGSHQSTAPGWPWINTTDPSSVSIPEYREWYSLHGSTFGPNITDCSLEEEMNKVFWWDGLNISEWLFNRWNSLKLRNSKTN